MTAAGWMASPFRARAQPAPELHQRCVRADFERGSTMRRGSVLTDANAGLTRPDRRRAPVRRDRTGELACGRADGDQRRPPAPACDLRCGARPPHRLRRHPAHGVRPRPAGDRSGDLRPDPRSPRPRARRRGDAHGRDPAEPFRAAFGGCDPSLGAAEESSARAPTTMAPAARLHGVRSGAPAELRFIAPSAAPDTRTRPARLASPSPGPPHRVTHRGDGGAGPRPAMRERRALNALSPEPPRCG